jgi:DnaK suppressor protein
MSAGISDPTRPDAARELGGLQIIDNRPLAVSLLRPDEFSRLVELAEPVRAPGVQMQFGKRAGDHTADAVLQMTRTISAGQLQRVATDIDRALEKLEDGSYGTCEECGRLIAPERLEALVWATRCVECQTLRPKR